MDVTKRPTELVFIWASLKRCFDFTISEFLVSDVWCWKEFCDLTRHASPTGAYYWVTTSNVYRRRPNFQVGRGEGHRLKVTRLILRTAKECWLPRRELIEDEYVKSMNEAFMRVPPAKQLQERRDLETATKIAKFKRQLGGFYLVWALYWNQPTLIKKFQHLEITPHDYETMKAFQNDLKTMPIYFLHKEARARLIEEVEFMMNQLIHVFAYDVCLFAEEYNWKDMTYLIFKYKGKSEILEWEKSLKERLLFHPKLREAISAIKNKTFLEKEAADQFDQDFVTKALDFLKKRARGNKQSADPRSEYPQPGSSKTGINRVSESEVETGNCGIASEADDPLCELAKVLMSEVMERPYTLEDLVPPTIYRAFARAANRSACKSRGTKAKRTKGAKAKGKEKKTTKKKETKNKRKAKPVDEDIDYGNVDNLTPVLQAIGLTPNIKDKLDPVLNQYFSMLLRDKKKSSKPKNQGGRPTKKLYKPQEWNLINSHTPRPARPKQKKQLPKETPPDHDYGRVVVGSTTPLPGTEKIPTMEHNEAERHSGHSGNFINDGTCDMPRIIEPQGGIKREPVPLSSFEPNLDDLDIINECEQALQHILSSPASETSPVRRGFQTPDRERIEPDDPDANSEDDEANVEEILQKLTNFPGLLGELKRTPQRKRTASLKVGKRTSREAKLRKLFGSPNPRQ